MSFKKKYDLKERYGVGVYPYDPVEPGRF